MSGDAVALEFAVSANAAAATAHGASLRALARADERFRASAAAFVAASAAGWSDSEIGRAVAAWLDGRSTIPADVQGEFYTSPAGVAYHIRTGKLFQLAGEVDGMTAREVQALVRCVPAGEVDRILAASATQAEAVAALKRAKVAKVARQPVPDPVTPEPPAQPGGQDGRPDEGGEGLEDHNATWYLVKIAEQVAEIRSQPLDAQGRALVKAIIAALLPLASETENASAA